MTSKWKYAVVLPCLMGFNAMAQEPWVHIESRFSATARALGNTALFALVGLILMIIGFKVFDKIITNIDLQGEIKKGNIAAAILSAGLVIGLALIIAASMS